MKMLLMVVVCGALCIDVVACGGSGNTPGGSGTHTSASSKSSTTPSYAKADADKDNDISAPYDDTNNNSVLDFGHAADAADRRAVTTLLKQYYAAAAAGDGMAACSMIYATLAAAVPEDYGREPGPSYLHGGKTCAAVMDLLFKHSHGQLVADDAVLEVTHVRLVGNHGLAVLSFGTMPERQIAVAREGHAWKVEALLDSELP